MKLLLGSYHHIISCHTFPHVSIFLQSFARALTLSHSAISLTRAILTRYVSEYRSLDAWRKLQFTYGDEIETEYYSTCATLQEELRARASCSWREKETIEKRISRETEGIERRITECM